MKKIEFDPADPPSAGNPLPAYGTAPGMQLLQALIRMTHSERQSARLEAEERAHLVEIEEALSASLSPATANDIRQAVGALLNHYPARPLSDDAAASVVKDWITDLGRFPADVVWAVCQQWRQSPNTYAPTPGHLIERAEPIVKSRTLYLRMVRQVLGSGDVQRAERKAG